MKRWLGALILIAGVLSLLAIRAICAPDQSCDYDVAFNLKGTFTDCEARGIPRDKAKAEERLVDAR